MSLKGAVQIVNHRSQGSRLTRSGRSSNENQALFFVTELLEYRRHFQLLKRQDLGRDGTKNRSLAFSLHENIDAEASDRAHLEREVALVTLLKCLALRIAHDVVNKSMHFFFR